jgi:hypothetical protein
MTHDANIRLTGKQMRLVEEGLRNAFVDYNDLARLVLYDLDERLNEIVVEHATFRDQIVQLIQWAEAKGKTKNLLLAAAREVPGNSRLREAKQAVLGVSDLDDLETSRPRRQRPGPLGKEHLVLVQITHADCRFVDGVDFVQRSSPSTCLSFPESGMRTRAQAWLKC